MAFSRKAASAVDMAAIVREFYLCAATTQGNPASGGRRTPRKLLPGSGRVEMAFVAFCSIPAVE